MNKKTKMKPATLLVHAGRNKSYANGAVNIPPYRSSTVLFDTLEEYQEVKHYEATSQDAVSSSFRYGRLGSPNSFALEEAYSELTGAYRSVATNSGMSAINIAVSAFLEQGSHALVTQGAYEPAAELFTKHLGPFGVKTQFISPSIGREISDLIVPETKLVYLEAPSSHTFEIPDIDILVESIRDKSQELGTEIVITFDNTWAGPLYFRPLEHGIDIEILSATKYVVGHSDAMLGLVACTEKTYQSVKNSSKNQGISAEPDACYLGLRGLRTMAIRMQSQFESANEVANWLEKQELVTEVLYPPLNSSSSHDNWKKYFTGGGSLMSIILDKKYTDSQLAVMLDNMELFAMGYSYGGFESLITPCKLQKERVSGLDQLQNTIIRLYIGLEDISDLINDLESGFNRLKKI